MELVGWVGTYRQRMTDAVIITAARQWSGR
jgi:hypothetical protein